MAVRLANLDHAAGQLVGPLQQRLVEPGLRRGDEAGLARVVARGIHQCHRHLAIDRHEAPDPNTHIVRPHQDVHGVDPGIARQEEAADRLDLRAARGLERHVEGVPPPGQVQGGRVEPRCGGRELHDRPALGLRHDEPVPLGQADRPESRAVGEGPGQRRARVAEELSARRPLGDQAHHLERAPQSRAERDAADAEAQLDSTRVARFRRDGNVDKRLAFGDRHGLPTVDAPSGELNRRTSRGHGEPDRGAPLARLSAGGRPPRSGAARRR